MRKIVYTIFIALLAPVWLMAQGTIAEIWTQPAVFVADEQVSIFFDVTGTVLDGVAESEGVRVWTWYPNNPDENWANPSAKTKLAHVSGNIWRWDLKPTELYNLPADQISAFYGQLQNYAGTKITSAFAPDQGNAITIYSLATIKADEAIIDYYPKQFTQDRPLSILINANHTWSGCEATPKQGELAKASDVRMHGGVNGWDVQVMNNTDNLSKTQLTNLGNGIYRKDIIINDYFGLASNYTVTGINMVFADKTWAYQGKGVNCADFYIAAPEKVEEVTPTLTFFPQKVSRKDIFCIIRDNNESNVTKLSYTITAGSITIAGDFEGNTTEMIAYINLADQLKDTVSLEKINVVIKNSTTGKVLSQTDIPLVQLND
ncbi:MAG TPA: hypothetical protein PLG33_09830 [Prolixibacteraceae bacterium]|nr:hypothetical protein [Prolixibacteraceae bacterium]HPR86343.1 hypothetical protein [Prolixibacteraceae bacterium]